MKRFRVLSIIAVALMLAVPMSAMALPADHRHAEAIPVDCDSPLEDVDEVIVNSHSNSASAFLPDGRVAVAKLFEGTIALTVDGDVVFSENFTESQGGHGRGHQDRLTECRFEFSEPIFEGQLTEEIAEELAAFLDVPVEVFDDYIGGEVAIAGSFEGAVSVKLPGNR